jgi:hypothetical protein
VKRILGILMIAVVVAATGVAYWRYGTHAAQSDVVPELLLYVPADAKVIVYLDAAALRSSAFAADLIALGPSQTPDREYLEFVQATGFDFSRDLDRVVMIIRQQTPAEVALAVAEGKFDRARITAYALRSGKAARANGADIFEIPQPSSGKNVALTFLDEGRIALAQGVGGRAALESLLQRGREASLVPAMRERIVRVSGSPIFAVGQLEKLPDNMAVGGVRSDQLNNMAQNIRWATLGLRPEGEVVQIAADGECDTPENAHQLAGTFDGLQLLAQSILSDPKTRARLAPQVVTLLDSVLRDLHVSQDGVRVRLTLQLTHTELRDALRTSTTPAGR